MDRLRMLPWLMGSVDSAAPCSRMMRSALRSSLARTVDALPAMLCRMEACRQITKEVRCRAWAGSGPAAPPTPTKRAAPAGPHPALSAACPLAAAMSVPAIAPSSPVTDLERQHRAVHGEPRQRALARTRLNLVAGVHVLGDRRLDGLKLVHVLVPDGVWGRGQHSVSLEQYSWRVCRGADRRGVAGVQEGGPTEQQPEKRLVTEAKPERAIRAAKATEQTI